MPLGSHFPNEPLATSMTEVLCHDITALSLSLVPDVSLRVSGIMFCSYISFEVLKVLLEQHHVSVFQE